MEPAISFKETQTSGDAPQVAGLSLNLSARATEALLRRSGRLWNSEGGGNLLEPRFILEWRDLLVQPLELLLLPGGRGVVVFPNEVSRQGEELGLSSARTGVPPEDQSLDISLPLVGCGKAVSEGRASQWISRDLGALA